MAFIDANRGELGVEPICTSLQVAPSTYYAARARPLSARATRDAVLGPVLRQLWEDNYRVYVSVPGSCGRRLAAPAVTWVGTTSPG